MIFVKAFKSVLYLAVAHPERCCSETVDGSRINSIAVIFEKSISQKIQFKFGKLKRKKMLLEAVGSYLSICLSMCLSICPSIHLYLSICIYPSVSIHPSIHQSIHLSIYLSICLSVCLSVCLSFYLSLCIYIFHY